MQCAMKKEFCYATLALIKQVSNLANIRRVMLLLRNSEKKQNKTKNPAFYSQKNDKAKERAPMIPATEKTNEVLGTAD